MEGRPLLHLSFLELAQEFVLESFQLLAFLLVVSNLLYELIGMVVDIHPGEFSLLLYELVLLGQALLFLLAYLLLSILRLVEVFLAHSI